MHIVEIKYYASIERCMLFTDPDSTRNESLETVVAVGEDAFAVKKGVPRDIEAGVGA